MQPKKTARKPWEPKRQVLSPKRRGALLEKIARDPTILHFRENPKAYKSLLNSFRKSEYYGHGGLTTFLEKGLEITPIRRNGKYYYPVKQTPASVKRFIEARLEEGVSMHASDWKKDPALHPAFTHAAKTRYLGMGSWENLLHHIQSLHRERVKREKEKKYAQTEAWLREKK